MTMYLCDDLINIENTNDNIMVQKKRCFHNVEHIPRIGEKVSLGYYPCSTVENIAYDYEHDFVIVSL